MCTDTADFLTCVIQKYIFPMFAYYVLMLRLNGQVYEYRNHYDDTKHEEYVVRWVIHSLREVIGVFNPFIGG